MTSSEITRSQADLLKTLKLIKSNIWYISKDKWHIYTEKGQVVHSSGWGKLTNKCGKSLKALQYRTYTK